MIYEFTPRGVCSRKMTFDIDGGVVRSLKVDGGCNGNLQGISSLINGMKIDDVIERLSGIRCGSKPTSCPAQVAEALVKFKAEN